MSAHTRHTMEASFFAVAVAVMAIVCLGVCCHRGSVETFSKGIELVQTMEERTASMEGLDIGTETLADLYL